MMANSLQRIEQGEFFLIAGPCVIESEETCLEVGHHVAQLASKFDIPYIFKTSFKKANRLSAGSYAGPGLDEGLRILHTAKMALNVPVLTDIHETTEADPVSEIADIMQIPAFLCRQTDLLTAAASTGRWVNIKKGQFLAPEDMAKIAAKVDSKKIMLTERGSTFGYRNLVVDFRSLMIMSESGYPVVFDATHSLQLPGGAGRTSTGQPEYIIPMAKAAVAVGINGLFVETHPKPSEALSDAGAMLPLEKMEELIDSVLEVMEHSR
ncbi:MAG: 3-deoxy-8-phosphooctulonate synthase [Candidatus Zixiibacteriota bacterium]|nr:MAG: 3-deoxy-8-phosphooctulonate synthase [candidate division Zixibacteria bacterium]